jgi:rhodanese-related sulfurtransferase
MNDPVLQVKPTELKKWMDASADIELIDVREQHEHREFNIGGRLVPLGEVMQQADTIPKHRKVILYCKLGIRSQIAIQRLQDRFGFNNLLNLKGGIEAWKREIK